MSAKIRSLNDFLALLKGIKRERDGQYKALCPGHNDREQSLSIRESEGKILLHCFAGCSTQGIIQAMNLTMADLFTNGIKAVPTGHKTLVATFSYEHEKGQEAYQIRRFALGNGKKTFEVWHKEDGKYVSGMGEYKDKPILYHKPEVKEWVASSETIRVPEGETKADRLIALGLLATSSPFGAGHNKWKAEYSQELAGADVIILPDNDRPGHEFAEIKATSLYGIAKSVKIVELPSLGDKGDIIDWLDMGHTKDELLELEASRPEWQPSEGTTTQKIDAPPILELPAIVWQGLFKDYRDLVADTTEAADAFHYATFCQMLGCTIGRRLHVYHATKLYPNFYICLVGKSGLTRKDTCWSRASDLLNRLHTESDSDEDPPFRIVKGIRSYEGLLDELAGERKVRLIQLGELLSLLAKAKQESLGNIVPQLAELYDCPDWVNPPVHQKTVDCREPFVSIMAGTTQAWLQKALTERDIYGGFANRWLYFFGLPKEPKPNPPKVNPDKRDDLVKEINQIRLWAEDVPNGEVTISDEASAQFAEYYRDYYRHCQQEGLIPTLIVRIQDFIWKLALLYAAMDLSGVIRENHIKAAIAVGDYLESSVGEVFRSFGNTRGKQREVRIIDYLKSAGQPMDYRLIYKNLNMAAKELDFCIEPLIKLGVIKNSYRQGKMGKSIRMLEAV